MTALQKARRKRKFRIEQNSTDLVVWKRVMRGALQNYGRICKGLARHTETEQILRLRCIDARRSETFFLRKKVQSVVINYSHKNENTGNWFNQKLRSNYTGGQRGRIDAFELWCWRRLLRVPWTARRSNQSIVKISPGISFEGMMLKLKLQYFGHLM